MFKVANLDTIRAIVGQGDQPLTPSAFADFLEELREFQETEMTQRLDVRRTLVLCDEAGQQMQLDLKVVLPVQMARYVHFAWKAIRKDDLESTIQLRNAIFGSTWLTVTIAKGKPSDGSPHRGFEAILAPSGHLREEELYIKSRGAFTRSLAHLAACARAITPAAHRASVGKAVTAFAEAVSGDNPVYYELALNLLPDVVFGHVKGDIMEAMKSENLRRAREVQLRLLGEQYRASLYQVGQVGEFWSCQVTHHEQVDKSVIGTPPCRDVARAMVVGTLLTYAQSIEMQQERAA